VNPSAGPVKLQGRFPSGASAFRLTGRYRSRQERVLFACLKAPMGLQTSNPGDETMTNTTPETPRTDTRIDDQHGWAETIDRLIAELLRSRRRVAILWSIEDVQTIRPDLDADQCWEVLQQAEQEHDANCGITWESLETIAWNLYEPRTETDAT
jgi:hypothetical protein